MMTLMMLTLMMMTLMMMTLMIFCKKNLGESSEHAVEDVVVAFLWVLTNDSHLHKKSLMILEVECLVLIIIVLIGMCTQRQAP